VYQFKDHLGNIRLSYSDRDNDGKIDVVRNNIDIDGDNDNLHEIIQIQDYYPFGLEIEYGADHPNSLITGSNEHPYKYNGVELNESLGLDLYEMPLRQYDPAIARFTSIDPVVHHSMSPYNAFDNNPVFWADPSGADAACNTCGEAADMYGRNRYDKNGMYIPPHERKEKTNSSNDPTVNKDEFTQRHPEKIGFTNVKTKKDKEKFLGQVVEWFGFVNKYGSRSVHPASIIDFYAEPKTKKSLSQKAFDFFENVIGGDSEDHNYVNIADGNGNSVKVGYFKHVRDHADLYSGSSVDFQGDYNTENVYRISLRSHDIGAGKPQAVIYMLFTGQNKKFYDQIAKRINAYKYTKVKIIPHKKQ
jgi:RHS repeat-associated protein